MTDKIDLLHELRIERGRGDRVGVRAPPWLGIGAAAVVLAVIVVGGYALHLEQYLPLTAAVANVRTAVATGSGANSGSQGALLEASGYVVARRQATVSAKITGKITAVLVEEGQHVDAGQILARLDDSNILAQVGLAEANAIAARVAYADAGPIFLRSKRILAQGISTQGLFDTSKAAFDAARTNVLQAERALAIAQRGEDDTVVRAPFAGIVTDKTANEGEIVSPISAGGGYTRTGICTIVDMESLEVNVDVNETFINVVHAGQPAVIKLDAYPGEEIPAEVIAIIPTADRAKGTVRVRVAIKTPNARILPDMSASVTFRDIAKPLAVRGLVYVPADAVLSAASQKFVFVVSGDHVERHEVSIGSRTAQGIAVLSGVASGDRLAVGDLSKLSDGEKVRLDE